MGAPLRASSPMRAAVCALPLLGLVAAGCGTLTGAAIGAGSGAAIGAATDTAPARAR